MHRKIYFGSKPLFLCDRIDEEIEPYLHHDDAVFIDELNLHTVKTMLHEMQLEKVHAGVFLHHDLAELENAFAKKWTLIQAAGGLVRNESEENLLIFRKGKWDLPKGKIDEGEELEACALREVKEETGLTGITLVKPLLVTWHTYQQGTHLILKESHWYLMTCEGPQNLQPQLEEDITEARWVSDQQLPDYFENAFSSVVDVLKTWLAK
ncbi:MAG: NUDIX hydrolase [Chitinophagaceae bacterium]